MDMHTQRAMRTINAVLFISPGSHLEAQRGSSVKLICPDGVARQDGRKFESQLQIENQAPGPVWWAPHTELRIIIPASLSVGQSLLAVSSGSAQN